MVEMLRNKNVATKFQILVEIANSGPNIQQRDIAVKLGVTPQAISGYVRQLEGEGLITSDGRSKHRVTKEGVNWIIRVLRELRSYGSIVERVITNISVCAAVASTDLVEGQVVGLEMKGGLLFATKEMKQRARGIACSDAKAGEDIGVSNIAGIVDLGIGEVTILKVPSIGQGGSRMTDIEKLEMHIKSGGLVGAIGIEAIVALKQAKIKSLYSYGVIEAAIEAAQSGIYPVVVCVEDMTSILIRRLEEADINYKLVDIQKTE